MVTLLVTPFGGPLLVLLVTPLMTIYGGSHVHTSMLGICKCLLACPNARHKRRTHIGRDA